MISKTITLRIDPANPDSESVAQAGRLLREGGTVAFPTETVYGLGANACDHAAVQRIFEAKGRPTDNPLIVHIADRAQLDPLVLPYSGIARRLMDRFWPGPLTLVLPVRPGVVSPHVTAGLDTVAVRLPAHPVALAVIAAAGCPVAAPSANSSGRPSPTEVSHVLDDLDGRIDAVIDGGAAGVGLESTVVEIIDGGSALRILRPGGVTAEDLREVVPRIEYDEVAAPGQSASTAREAAPAAAAAPDAGRIADIGPAILLPGGRLAHSAPRSPGMKYAHYAPRGIMELVQGEPAAASAYIQGEVRTARARGERTGVLVFTEHAHLYDADHIAVVGSLAHLETAAQGLYAALRSFDDNGVQRIWAESCPEQGIGHAFMNRVAKAAAHLIVRV
ncbi:threonylcarbamoyl-AMP synthase [Paenibacillus sp. sptzw28]|uniref:L-threonylcarbamoyladenylate synthase n=1 Tax=Paenibacillus sp. sptzw28 TaxID=715179 RepID=UPI001C6DE7CF|nr:L-threonylcarbamoyladenylate synthase [Paenibacillus sp. sptzw28]QYR22042.1 threonylcarbamoyl-AMP synthase [Paenibacillus sp. sptzw28]